MPALKPLAEKPPRLNEQAMTPLGNAAGAAGRPAPHGGGHSHQPSVECVKQGDKVTHLVVTCACGERIEIDCLYAGPA